MTTTKRPPNHIPVSELRDEYPNTNNKYSEDFYEALDIIACLRDMFAYGEWNTPEYQALEEEARNIV